MVSRRAAWKVFVKREITICYKERGIGDCQNGFSHLLQGEGDGMCLLKGTSPSVTRRVAWNVFVIREFLICYKEKGMKGVCCNVGLHRLQKRAHGCYLL